MPVTSLRQIAIATLAFALCAPVTQAHEFWIDPVAFEIASGGDLVADIRVGQEFEGAALSYLPNSFRQFAVIQGDANTPVLSRTGDRPALNQAPVEDGLAVLVHETTDSIVIYTEFEKFESFVSHKDALWVVDIHLEEGLPNEFREVYSRYAKSLVSVGAGAGRDAEAGLETEIVALANPYTDDVSEGFPVRVLYRGAVRQDAQVEIFEQAPNGDISVSTVRTNDEGTAIIPVRNGYSYMLDSVVLRRPEGDSPLHQTAVWESLWANLTFAVPE